MMRGNARGGWRSTNAQPQPSQNSYAAAPDSMDYYSTAPVSKLEQMDAEMQPAGNGTEQAKKGWRLTAEGKIRKKRKKTFGEKNLKLKKYVQPKNAVMCLNELRPGIVYNVEKDGDSIGQATFVSVEIDGQKYRGYGSSKQLAKQAAAEAALISFVKPPLPNADPTDEDKTPWAVLACFAMYKLFSEWREGRVGTMSAVNSNMMGPGVLPAEPTVAQTLQALLGRPLPINPSSLDGLAGGLTALPTEANAALSAYLGKAVEKEDAKQVPQPAKQLPDNAIAMNPVMLLHQMKPGLQFTQTQNTDANHKVTSTVTADIDGKKYSGEGPNMKKAKYELAVKANAALFGIATTYDASKCA